MKWLAIALVLFNVALTAAEGGSELGTLDNYLSLRGFNLSPRHSAQNEGYASEAQRGQFAWKLKQYSSIKTIAEVGLNAGHSAESFFLNCGTLEKLVSFDINWRPYTGVAVEYFRRKYDGRFVFEPGDSKQKVPEFATRFPDQKFDLIYIDGDHSFEGCLADIVNFKNLSHSDTILWIDDLGLSSVDSAIEEAQKQGLITILNVYESYDKLNGSRCWVEARYRLTRPSPLRH